VGQRVAAYFWAAERFRLTRANAAILMVSNKGREGSETTLN